MGKFNPPCEYIKNDKNSDFQLSFDQIQEIADLPIDHSFLTYKKELRDCGFGVGRISLKNKTVGFKKLED